MPRDAAIPPHHRFAHFAMATEFELFVADAPAKDASGLAVEVFREIDRLERELSRFLEGSDIFRINRTKPGNRVRVGPEAFICLKQALQVTELTHGAFDVTFGSDPQNDSPQTHRDLLSLDETDFSVEVRAPGVRVDLGGIGKGFALDWVGDILEDWEMTHCLVQSGGSSILALDPPEGHAGWPVGVGEGPTRRVHLLRRQALCASGTEVKGEHIVDARQSGQGRQCLKTWVLAERAGWADALSTAFMLMRPEEIKTLCACSDGVAAALSLAAPDPEHSEGLLTYGDWPPTVTDG
ncbi:MAG: FAD:protein FMN transferase [Planctomycetes bacterium]|nr:FAD:protein FMN transferase [Planctomycetota bacterium]